MPNIHPTAIVDSSAKLADDVNVGAYAVIGANVEIGQACSIGPHVVINGPTIMGKSNRVFQFASLGEEPQDLSYRGQSTRLEIGDHNVFREFVTVQRGTDKDQAITRIGNHCYFMNYSHVGHDCTLHDHVMLANTAALAGHIEVFDHAKIGAFCAVHQFSRIGQHAFIARAAQLPQDIAPFLLVTGPGCELHGINMVGLKREGFSLSTVRRLREVFQIFFRRGHSNKDALALLLEMREQDPAVACFYDFVSAPSQRGIFR